MNIQDVQSDKYDEIQLSDFVRKHQTKKSKAALEHYIMDSDYARLKSDTLTLLEMMQSYMNAAITRNKQLKQES